MTGWTPVVGRNERRPQNLPQAFFPPDTRKCYTNDSDSDSDQDLNDVIPDHAAVTFRVVESVPWLHKLTVGLPFMVAVANIIVVLFAFGEAS